MIIATTSTVIVIIALTIILFKKSKILNQSIVIIIMISCYCNYFSIDIIIVVVHDIIHDKILIIQKKNMIAANL